MADQTNFGRWMWLLAGTAIGASAAVLFAPASGDQTRAAIARRTGEGRAVLTGSAKEMLDRGQEMIERARRLTEEAADMFEKGRQLVENTAAHLEQNG